MSFVKSFTCRAVICAVLLCLLLTLSLVSLYWQLGLINDKIHNNQSHVDVNESQSVEDTIARLNPDGKAVYFTPGHSFLQPHFHGHHHHHHHHPHDHHHKDLNKGKHSHLIRGYDKGESACTSGPLFPVGKSTVITISTEDGERNFVVYIPTSYEAIHRRSVPSANDHAHKDTRHGKYVKQHKGHHHHHHHHHHGHHHRIPVLSSTLFKSPSWRWWRRHFTRKTHEYTPAGMLLLFHGINDNCDRFLNATGFISYAQQDGFIIVSACGSRGYLGVGWNAGECCGFWNEHPDDVQFAKAIVNAVSNAVCIDADRVMAGGFSNGAMMAEVVGCNSPQLFRSIFSVGGVVQMRPGNAPGLQACSNAIRHNISDTTRPSVLMVHGDADYKVPWSGNHWIGFPAMDDNVHGWAERCGCTHGTPSCTINTTQFVNTIYEDCFIEAGHDNQQNQQQQDNEVHEAKQNQHEINTDEEDSKIVKESAQHVVSAIPAISIVDAGEENGNNNNDNKMTFIEDILQFYDDTGVYEGFSERYHGQKCKPGTHNCFIRKHASHTPHSRHDEKDKQPLPNTHSHDVHQADNHRRRQPPPPPQKQRHKKNNYGSDCHAYNTHSKHEEKEQVKAAHESRKMKDDKAERQGRKHFRHNTNNYNGKNKFRHNNHKGKDNFKMGEPICFLPSDPYYHPTVNYRANDAKRRTDVSNATVEVVRVIGGAHTWPETSDFSTTDYIYNFGLRVFDHY